MTQLRGFRVLTAPMVALARRYRARLDNSLLLVIILLGTLLRFHQIGRQPLWLDEAFSVWMSRLPVNEMIRLTIDVDQHPPLYHLFLHGWMQLGGDSEIWVRSLSALAGVLTIPVLFAFARSMGGSLVGGLAALLLAVSPLHIQFAQESRSYALLTLFAGLAMWMTARLLKDSCTQTCGIGQQLRQLIFARPTISNELRPNQDVKLFPTVLKTVETDLTWLGYILFTAVVVYFHNTAIFFPVAINLFVLGWMVFQRFIPPTEGQLHAPALKNWIIAQAGMALLWLPWLGGFYQQAAGVERMFWLSQPTWNDVLEALQQLFLAHLPERISWSEVIWVGFGAAVGLALLRFLAWPERFMFPTVLILVPFLGELLVSFWQPIFYARTLLWTTLPLFVLIAAGISQLRYRSYIVTSVVILITLNLLSLNRYYSYYEKERWDLAAQYVAENAARDDVLLFNAGWTQIPFDYYFDRYNRPLNHFGLPATLFESGELEPAMTQADLPRLRSILSSRSRAWLVYSHYWWTDPDRLIPEVLNQEMQLRDMMLLDGIELLLFERE